MSMAPAAGRDSACAARAARVGANRGAASGRGKGCPAGLGVHPAPALTSGLFADGRRSSAPTSAKPGSAPWSVPVHPAGIDEEPLGTQLFAPAISALPVAQLADRST
ncbi:hypothetical protein [Sorangium sp. So ce307]|uniref:hypothetical protein n=1 Tax=Sorangium sp. So ce307 TaxID=3133298 RepID=UPI003F603B36